MAARSRPEMKHLGRGDPRLAEAVPTEGMSSRVLRKPDYEIAVFWAGPAALMLSRSVVVLMAARWDSRRLCCWTQHLDSKALGHAPQLSG